MSTRLEAWLFGTMVTVLALAGATPVQSVAKDMDAAPGILPSSYGEAVDRDIMTIRDATARLRTTEAAEAAGYKRVTDCIEHQPAGAMGYHFQNNALLDATLDLQHPEVLVYEKLSDGSFQLNGVEFLVPISAWKSSEPPRILGQALTRADSIGFWFLHVWTWKPSPSGLFAPWNPDVKCLQAALDEASGFPAEFRKWAHVKSVLVGPQSAAFATEGGIHHIYASDKALEGYQTGRFPDGAVIVYDLLETREIAGNTVEGPTRRVDVMLKKPATGGWEFMSFSGNDQAHGKLSAERQATCVACHSRRKDNDFVFSEFRR